MIITPLPETPLVMPPGDVRSPGVHASSIIRCIAVEQGILKPEWCEELSLSDARSITDTVAVLRIRMGLAWERHYLPTVEGIIYQPGEILVDGIYMTPDGESLSVVHVLPTKPWAKVLHECKLTYKSMNTVGNLYSEWMWLAQCLAYCKGSETRFAQMHVLFVCGDYTYPIKPRLRIWVIEFSQEEIDMNWNLLRDYRDSFALRYPSKDSPLENPKR